MDTILIIRDSVACCVNKTAEICQPCIKEVGASWQDVVFVGIICAAILIIALFAICKYYNDKEKERENQIKILDKTKPINSEKSDQPQKSPEEKAMEAEIKRQSRISDLMKEICELTRDPSISKDVKGKYNDTEAEKLWNLYKEIDSYNKGEECKLNTKAEQNGEEK